MGKVVARFYVSGVTKKPDGTAEVNLQAAMSKENARWSQYTPAGSVTMSLTRKASGARSVFEGVIDKAVADGTRPECLVTFDFDVDQGETPEYVQGEGYVSDEALDS